MNIYWLDLVGVFAFAFLGARLAIQQRCNVLGIGVYALLPAVGGGTMRELLLNHIPFYFQNHTYLVVVGLAATLAAILYRHFDVIEPLVLTMDAVGSVAFAFIGAQAAAIAHLGLFGIVFFAVLTACGGGVLCDLVARRAPRAFHDGLYTLPTLLLGCAYWLLDDAVRQPMTGALLVGGAIFVQMMVVEWGAYAHGLYRQTGKKWLRKSRIFQRFQRWQRLFRQRHPELETSGNVEM